MRVGGWTLKIQTQAGNCRIAQIGDMIGVGTAWCYPEGVANVLSQLRVASLSKWSVSYDTGKHHENGNTKDLCY